MVEAYLEISREEIHMEATKMPVFATAMTTSEENTSTGYIW